MDHLRKFSKSQFLKKAIQFIIFVSVILFISSNSSLLPFIVQSFNDYYSTVSTYSAERNYMFLLFNGILVFIVKNSGLIGNYAALQEPDPAVLVNKKGDNQCSAPELLEKRALVEQEYERNDGLLTRDYLNELPADQEEEDIGLLSTEELNKKCDEFIRKMKEVIKIEAKQLIMV